MRGTREMNNPAGAPHVAVAFVKEDGANVGLCKKRRRAVEVAVRVCDHVHNAQVRLDPQRRTQPRRLSVR